MQKITLNSNTRGCTALKKFLGYEGENDANKLVFVFADGFIDGTAILNIKRGEDIGYVEVEKVGETYEFPIKNSILGQVGEITFQLALTTSSGKRIIYDELVLEVKEAIEADTEMPEDYPSWKSLADTKIAEINEAITQANAINIVASKVGKTATITITKKDGKTETIQIFDGEIGPMGLPNTLTIGSVEKGDEARVWITGEAPNQVLHFILPKGDTGKQGEKGETGNDGANGKDGTEIELQVTETYIQWRYVNSENWNNLIALSVLQGKDGDKGKNLEFNWKGTSLGVRQEGQTEYVYKDLEGKPGETGPAGTTDFYELINKPTKLSQFTNDKNFITNAVNNLLYYYNKTEVENLLKNVSVDLTGYAKEDWVNTKLTNYLTSSQILELVNNALNNYYTTTQIDKKLEDKVDKVEGKSLVEDTEIARLKTLENYDDTELRNELSNKINKSTIITTIDSDTLLLGNNQDARLGELATLILNMPAELDERYESLFSFRSGATPTTLTYSATPIKWQGDDCNASGEFIPEANTSYEISIRKVNDTDIIARVGGY